MWNNLLEMLASVSPAVEVLVKLTALLVLAWAMLPLVSRGNPRWQVFCWRCVVVALLMMPIVVLVGPGVRVPVVKAESIVQATPVAVRDLEMLPVAPWEVDVAGEVGLDAISPVHESKGDVVVGRAAAVALEPRWSWWTVAVAVWGLAAGILFAGAACRDWRMARIVRSAEPASAEMVEVLARVAEDMGHPGSIRVRVSSEVHSPRVTAWLNPAIVMPKAFEPASRDELRAVFAHELSHVVSGDLAWSRVFQWVTIGLWFHPLVWGLRRRHLDACDRVSDATAAEYLGDSEVYAGILARVALQVIGKQALAGIAMARSPQIKRRLACLGMGAARLRRRQVVPVGVIGLLILVGMGGLRLVEAGSPAESEVAVEQVDGKAVLGEKIGARGRVIDEAGKPVSGATVYLRDASAHRDEENRGVKRVKDVLAQTTTDKKGRFEFRDVPATGFRRGNQEASWEVICLLKGYGMTWRHLPAVESSEPMVLRVEPEVTVHGRVVDKGGNPISGVEVAASRIGGLREGLFVGQSATMCDLGSSELAIRATTDGDGKVVLRGLPADRCVLLSASHDDFSRAVVHVATTDAPQPGIPVPGSLQGQLGMSSMRVFSGEFSVEMAPAGPTVRGQVTRADDGKPCEGVQLALSGHGRSRWAVTDEEGRYVIRDASPSVNRIVVSPPPELQCLNESLEVDLKGVESEKTVDVALNRGHVVTGRITIEETGEGVAGARVEARFRHFEIPPNAPWDSRTDDSGRFQVLVPEGRSRIRIYGPVDTCLLPKFSKQTVSYDPRHYRDIEVVAGEKIEPVQFVVEQGKVVGGVVRDSEGKPVPGATVRVHQRDDRILRLEREGTTDQAGRYELAGFQTLEDLVISVYHRDRGLAGCVRLDAKYSDEEVTAEAVVEPAASFTGVVLLDGKPAEGVRVGLGHSRFVGQSTVTDEEGRYRFDLVVPGKDYRVTVSSEYHSEHVAKFLQAKAGETQEIRGLEVVSYRARVSGIIVDPQGNPVEGAEVYVRYDGGSRNLLVPTGKDGRFAIERLPDEPLELIATISPKSRSGRRIRAMAMVNVSPNQEGLRIMIDPALANNR